MGGSVFASDAPETSDMKFGMIALTDCSTIVIAHEKGLFKSRGSTPWSARGRAGRLFAMRFRMAIFTPRTCC
jgi:hypothetical protein